MISDRRLEKDVSKKYVSLLVNMTSFFYINPIIIDILFIAKVIKQNVINKYCGKFPNINKIQITFPLKYKVKTWFQWNQLKEQ